MAVGLKGRTYIIVGFIVVVYSLFVSSMNEDIPLKKFSFFILIGIAFIFWGIIRALLEEKKKHTKNFQSNVMHDSNNNNNIRNMNNHPKNNYSNQNVLQKQQQNIIKQNQKVLVKYCSNCGTPVRRNDRFCNMCGNSRFFLK